MVSFDWLAPTIVQLSRQLHGPPPVAHGTAFVFVGVLGANVFFLHVDALFLVACQLKRLDLCAVLCLVRLGSLCLVAGIKSSCAHCW